MTCKHYFVFGMGETIGVCGKCGEESKHHLTFREVTKLLYRRPYRKVPKMERIYWS